MDYYIVQSKYNAINSSNINRKSKIPFDGYNSQMEKTKINSFIIFTTLL